jgi:Zn finger protein HypA/HybF involved in hydrogenase expression
VSAVNTTVENAAAVVPANFDGLRELSIQVDDIFIVRQLGCRCGSNSGVVKGTPTGTDELPFLDPLDFECSDCGESVRFFDSSKHGYDGRLNGGASYEQGNMLSASSCDKCGSEAAVLECGLAYNTDFEEDDEPELLAQAQEYFDSIDVNVRCTQCDSARHIGAWELA